MITILILIHSHKQCNTIRWYQILEGLQNEYFCIIFLLLWGTGCLC